MKTSRTLNAALALLVLAGAGLWVKHNLRHEVASPPASPRSKAAVATPATEPLAASSPALSATPAPAAPSLAAALTASKDPRAVTADLSRIVLDSTRSASERDEALGHLLNLSAGDPAPVLLPLLADARLSDAQCNQILDDTLNGSLAWQADANLVVLSRRKSPAVVSRVREHLVFLLEADHGADIPKWTEAIAAAKKNWSAQP